LPAPKPIWPKARTDLGRRQALVHDGAVSGDELTIAENRMRQTEAALAGRQGGPDGGAGQPHFRRRAGPGRQRLVAGADVTTNPEVAAAQARVDQAKLDLERTVIRAPVGRGDRQEHHEIGNASLLAPTDDRSGRSRKPTSTPTSRRQVRA